jgi:hypothetical protein
VAISASAAPTNGDVLVASGSSTAAWAAPIGGGLIKSTFLTAKTGYTHTLNALTGTVRLRGKASGGGGGSAGSSDGENTSAGSGGAEGGEFVVTLDTTGISSITAITTGASAAGGAATGNHPGATGADTVCTMNGITYTAKGGLGGSSPPETNALTLVPGANGVQGTNGDINSPGLPGGIAVILAFGASSAGISGAGGGAGGGAARTTNGAGNAGSSYPTGGGGSGALGLSGYSAFYKGGDSSAGYLIVDEYMKVTLPGS